MRTILQLVRVGSIVFLLGAGVAGAQQAPQPPVYTICTLLVGSPPPSVPAGTEGAKAVMTALAGAKWSAQELAENTENLVELQEKLKSAFRVEQIEVISSYGDWMSPGRQMVLDGAGLKLVVTWAGTKDYAESEVVVHRGDGTSYSTRRERMNTAEYELTLSAGETSLLKRTSQVAAGMRSIFARQVEPGGPLYFIVLALPQPGVPMRTSFGYELEGGQHTASGVSVKTSTAVGRGEGIGIGVGTAREVQMRAPKKLSGDQPALPADARGAGLKGPVILAGTIAADGTVQNIKVLKPVDGLTELAIAAFKTWRYELSEMDKDGTRGPILVTVVFPFQDEPQE